MKKYPLFFVLVIAISYGCITHKVEMADRSVVNNTFYSSYPEMEITVESEFSYLGNLKYTRVSKSVSGTTGREYNDLYFFILAEDVKINKLLCIRFHRVEGIFNPDLFAGVRRKLQHGVCTLGERKYQYCAFLTSFIADYQKELVTYVSEKGYILPNYMLKKQYARLMSARKDTIVSIAYHEDLSGYGDTPSYWTRNHLGWLQKKYLNKFDENCENSFDVLK